MVFPQPTGPTKATISPGFILKEISSSIFLGESSYFIDKFFASNLPRIGLDIAPDHDEILNQDFLQWRFPKNKSIAVVGNPPFGIDPYSSESFSLATAYGLFHWGISAWSIYGIPAIALSIAFYKYNLNSLRLSSSLSGLGISKIESSLFGRFIDLIFILATVGAAGGTIGSYIPMLSSGFSEIFNLNKGLYLDILVICLCVGLFGYSVYKGLDKGIKNLSNFNLILALIFLLIILFSTDIIGLIQTSVSGLLFSITNFWDMSTLGISKESQFAEEWTIFYWAWWVAFGPLVGLFIARISRGRTLRQVILGMLFFGTLGTWLF